MVSWLKRFALSFFSDVQAEESVRGGFGTILLTCFLSFIFAFFGLFAGRYVPFSADYNGAGEFKEFLYNTFISADGSPEISISYKDGRAQITQKGGNKVINTLSSAEDKAQYSVNGYDLIVDARNVAYTYDDFSAYCVAHADGKEISYESYRGLSAGEQSNYYFAVRYSGKEKVISAEDVKGYKEYLATEEDAADKLKSIEDNRQNLTEKEYFNAVYELYIKTYYPQIYSFSGESVPTLRNYYYSYSLRAERGYFCLFGDMLVISFNSATNKPVYFGCAYGEDGGLFADGANENAQSEVDAFISGLYYESLPLTMLLELLNSLPVIIYTELIIVAFMLVCWQLCKFKKIQIGETFANSAKLIGSFAHVGALISAVLTLLAGFLIGGVWLTVCSVVLFAVSLAVRLAVLLVRENKKQKI